MCESFQMRPPSSEPGLAVHVIGILFFLAHKGMVSILVGLLKKMGLDGVYHSICQGHLFVQKATYARDRAENKPETKHQPQAALKLHTLAEETKRRGKRPPAAQTCPIAQKEVHRNTGQPPVPRAAGPNPKSQQNDRT